MVDKNFLDYVEEKIGRSVHPYDSDSPLTQDEAIDEYENWMDSDHLRDGFQEAEKIIYHPSPSDKEDDVRFELLEAVAFDLYAKNRNPEIYVSEGDRERVDESDVLHESAVFFSETEITENDISEAFRFSADGKSIHVTSDYHAGGVYGLRETFDEDDFIVLSADTSDIDPDPENYSEILRPASSMAADIFDWKTLAEGKEVGREITEWLRGPRF